jgi:hypothetical protein
MDPNQPTQPNEAANASTSPVKPVVSSPSPVVKTDSAAAKSVIPLSINQQMPAKPTAAQPAVKPVLRPMNAGTKPVMNPQKPSPKSPFPIIFGAILAIVLGIGSGYVLAGSKGGVQPVGGNNNGLQREVTEGDVKVGTKVGIADERTFKDNAEGQLEKGGINGEGSHHLVRPGGDSQTIYITSSVIDLDQFVGHKVKVWGETLGAQKAGWLMDVGKLEVLQ